MAGPDRLSTIEHIVVLMLENRSFDQMLGFLYADHGNLPPNGPGFDGLSGTESYPDAGGNAVSVFQVKTGDPYAYFMPGADPGEGYYATNSQLFGNIHPPPGSNAANQGFVNDFAYTLGWESQEHGWSILPGTKAASIMGMFTPQMLPVLSSLARGYAVCDCWYSSVPTETLPNRAFACAATSQGHMDDKTKSYTARSIFGLLTANNIGWAIYGYDQEPLTRRFFRYDERIRRPFRAVRRFHRSRRGRHASGLRLPRAELERFRQQPAPQLQRGIGRAADSRRLLRAAQRAGLESDPADRHLRRARRML